jgi:hypothetical protein
MGMNNAIGRSAPTPPDRSLETSNKKKFALVLGQALLAAAATVAAGCDPGIDDDVNPESQYVVTTKTGFSKEIDVGFGVKRPLEVRYGTICKKWEKEPSSKPGFPATMRCVQYSNDDAMPYKSSRLFQDTWMRDYELNYPADTSFGEPMPSYPAALVCGTVCTRYETVPGYKPGAPARKICVKTQDNVCQRNVYHGCGPAAAVNVLAYYGGPQIGTAEAQAIWIETFMFPASTSIATTPDALASGLSELLAWRADGNFKVTRKSGVGMDGEVRRAVDNGNPILLMVENGRHWVMVTGYEGDLVRVTDYRGSERKVPLATLGFDTIGPEFIGRPNGHYLPYTVITIERQTAYTNGLYKAVDNPGVYQYQDGKVCGLTWPQFVSLGQPSQRVQSSLEGQRFRGIFNLYPGRQCTNAEVGTWGNGFYKASNDPTVFNLKGQRACAVTWDQFVKLKQPAFKTLNTTEAPRFRDAFYKPGDICTNSELGL